MTPKEAAQILEVSPDISITDLKKKFREVAKSKHPDVGGDAEQFKKITSAYNDLLDFKENPSKYQTSPFHRVESYDTSDFPFEINIADIFSNFTSGNFRPNKGSNPPPRIVSSINLTANLSFKECVLGKEHDLEYDRDIKCDECNGAGEKNEGNGCQECDGRGRVVNQNGNMTYARVCSKCGGRDQKRVKCVKCAGKSFLRSTTKLTVQIPSGVADKSILKLQGAGNFSASNGLFGDHYTDVLLTVNIEKDPILFVQENDVICPLNLTLLEALEGCSKSVRTIHGEQTIEIKPQSRHKEEVVLKGLGVKGKNGDQRVIFAVIYDKVDELIKTLKEKKD